MPLKFVERPEESLVHGLIISKVGKEEGEKYDKSTMKSLLDDINKLSKRIDEIEVEYTRRIANSGKIGEYTGSKADYQKHIERNEGWRRQELRRVCFNLLSLMNTTEGAKLPDGFWEHAIPADIWQKLGPHADDKMLDQAFVYSTGDKPAPLQRTLGYFSGMFDGTSLDEKIQNARLTVCGQREGNPIMGALFLNVAAIAEIPSAQNTVLLTAYMRFLAENHYSGIVEKMKAMSDMVDELNKLGVKIIFKPYNYDPKFFQDISDGVIDRKAFLEAAKFMAPGAPFTFTDLTYCARFCQDMKNAGVKQYQASNDWHAMEWLTDALMPTTKEDREWLTDKEDKEVQDRITYKMGKGMAVDLYNYFGIVNFDIFPMDFLKEALKQAKNGSSKSPESGKHATIVLDHANFDTERNNDRFRAMLSSFAKNGYSISFQEVGTKEEWADFISQSYVPGANNVLVTSFATNFSGEAILSYIRSTSSLLLMSDMEILSQAKPPSGVNAQVIIIASRAGLGEANLASKMAEIFQCEVFAPDGYGAMPRVDLAQDGRVMTVEFISNSSTKSWGDSIQKVLDQLDEIRKQKEKMIRERGASLKLSQEAIDIELRKLDNEGPLARKYKPKGGF